MDVGRDPTEITAIVFLDIAVIVLAARLAGSASRRLGQPAVVGEILAGILLGPTLLGALPGDLSAELFPADARPFLTVLGDLGLIIFIFMVGLQLDLRLVRGLERATAISAASVALPFALGVALAAGLYPSHDTVGGSSIDFVPFALFMGVAMSITAFPVLARILLEHGMHRTHVGALVLACAALDDVLGWAVLAIALAALGGHGDVAGTSATLFETAAFAIGMIFVARPLILDRIAASYARAGALTPGLLSAIFAAIATSAWITHQIGVNFVFGAFLLGVAFPRPRTRKLLDHLNEHVEQVVTVLLLPIFFVLPGLMINLRDLGVGELGTLALIMLVACGGKFIGGAGVSRLLGSDWREAGAIGTLLNTRGVMELVVLNIGLAEGVLDLELYTLLVLMALLTTMMTGPLLRRIYPAELVRREVARAKAPLAEHPTPLTE